MTTIGEANLVALSPERVERILRACVAQRKRTPGRLPGQTEKLCVALKQAWLNKHEHMHGVDVCAYCAEGDIALAEVTRLRADLDIAEVSKSSFIKNLVALAERRKSLLIEWRDTEFFSDKKDWQRWVSEFGARVDLELGRPL